MAYIFAILPHPLISFLPLLSKRKKMSEVSKSTNQQVSNPITTNEVINTTTRELQNIQPGLCLNGKNYLKWSQFVQTFLKGKGKLSHLLRMRPKPDDLKFIAWDEEDSMVMS